MPDAAFLPPGVRELEAADGHDGTGDTVGSLTVRILETE